MCGYLGWNPLTVNWYSIAKFRNGALEVQGDCAATGRVTAKKQRTSRWFSVGQVKVTARIAEPTGVAIKCYIRVTISFIQPLFSLSYRGETCFDREKTHIHNMYLPLANFHTVWTLCLRTTVRGDTFWQGVPHFSGHHGSPTENRANGKASLPLTKTKTTETKTL